MVFDNATNLIDVVSDFPARARNHPQRDLYSVKIIVQVFVFYPTKPVYMKVTFIKNLLIAVSTVAEVGILGLVEKFVVIAFSQRFICQDIICVHQFLVERAQKVFSNEEPHLRTTSKMLVAFGGFSNAVKLNAEVGETITDVVAPVFELGPRPFKLVIPVTE